MKTTINGGRILTNTAIRKGYSPYINDVTGTWMVYDEELRDYVDSGEVVSAYLCAVSAGYTGTEDEFFTLMADYVPTLTSAVEAEESARASMILASESANDALGYAQDAENTAASMAQAKEDAEAWAVGQRDGVDVNVDDETYHNNAAYYAEQAEATLNSCVKTTAQTLNSTEKSQIKSNLGLGNMADLTYTVVSTF